MEIELMQNRYNELTCEATRLAGSLPQLSQRATVYRHLFLASGRNHTFPLIAAHGALWAGGYFRWGLQLGKLLSWQYIGWSELRKQQLEHLVTFANAFRDINRRVCVDTYVNFYFTEQFGNHSEVQAFIPQELLEPLNSLHAAQRAGRDLNKREKQELFIAHFLHEQKSVVGPTLTNAVNDFNWPLVRAIALRPLVRFSYFPSGTWLWFHNFASQEERIEKGKAAFDIAEAVGWSKVHTALEQYHLLPDAFFTQPFRYFAAMKESVLEFPAIPPLVLRN
jgi:hypothetical protein